MAYQALYRRWRPTTFSQVVGQEAIIKTLRRQIITGHIAHAYLFCGCRGTGKTTLAKIMSRAINCETHVDGDPCGKCIPCRSIIEESTLDVVELDAASNNGVDNVRELLEQVRYPAQVGKYKVYIIDEVHMLSSSAFNALLKTLEEPPEHVVFILATTEPQKLPATILSRVQRYDFGRIPSFQIVERMRLALSEFTMAADEDALQAIARAAEGALRDAFSILDMCIAGAIDGYISSTQVREVLGTSDKDFLFAFAQAISTRDTQCIMSLIDTLMRSGREPQVFLRELTSHIRALLTVKAVPRNAASLLDVTDEDEKRYRSQADDISFQRLLRILESLMHAEGELRFASTPRIALEVAALQACAQVQEENLTALLERVSELECQVKNLTQKISEGYHITPQVKDHKTPEQKSIKQSDKTTQPTSSQTSKNISSENTNMSVPQSPASASSAKEPKEIWKKALSSLRKSDPPIFGLLHGEQFLGAENNVYKLLIPSSKKDFSYIKLNQTARKDMISALLTELTGTPTFFEPILDENAAKNKLQIKHQQVENMLVEAFGRSLLQIDEEEQ